MWLIGLLLFFVTASRQLSISEFDVPDAVRLGDNASLQCRYELDPLESDQSLFVKWWWTPLNGSSDERTQLYQRIAGRDPVAIHHEIEIEDHDDILLLNVSVKDSGTYECEVSNIDEVRMSDTLIVFSSGSGVDLDLTTTDDGPDEDSDDDVLVTCQASDVAPYPDLTLTINGDAINASESVTSLGDDTYDILINMTVSELAPGSDVSCKLSFLNLNVSDALFTATETYNDSSVSRASSSVWILSLTAATVINFLR
ncbi:uncharacterized protein LOC126971674 isoform X2 [Leptidea sinapis]|uniref:uncharacterized protein LOC126971674 isoform X2 n=1 Tax=Leptidea sinapis TaxID=189913 RepID=UPI002142BC20|nr:uncharacterized protein LOC126971674 isoform X2 [Leptidea sinapis]